MMMVIVLLRRLQLTTACSVLIVEYLARSSLEMGRAEYSRVQPSRALGTTARLFRLRQLLGNSL